MQDYRCRVLLQHEYAQAFFDAALHPDLEELRRRDRFFEQIAQDTPYYDDDGDLVTEIPDIDVKLLMGAVIQYQTLSFTKGKTIKSYCVIDRRSCQNEKASVKWRDAYSQLRKTGKCDLCAAV